MPLLEHLLGDVYAIERAPGKWVFQNHVLGDQHFTKYYGLPARVFGESLLEKMDHSPLNAHWRAELLQRRAAGEWHPAIYTARPSLAPVEVTNARLGYTPEAEIGRDMAGLVDVPVMGLGKLDWWARQVGLTGADLVKPSPVQSMAAMAAAHTGLELESVKAAHELANGGALRHPLTTVRGQHVHVFEDSPSSLRAVKQAVELLNQHGLDLRLSRHGIGAPGSPKQATLAEVADGVYADIYLALEACVGVNVERV
jgi:hypothetical protein